MIDKILSKLPPRGTPQYVRTKRITLIVAAILLLGLPWVVTNKYYIHILISVGLYSILALSLNLVTGYAGQLSFCHVAFYGIGAYTGGLLMLRAGVILLAGHSGRRADGRLLRPDPGPAHPAAAGRLSGHCHPGLWGDRPPGAHQFHRAYPGGPWACPASPAPTCSAISSAAGSPIIT